MSVNDQAIEEAINNLEQQLSVLRVNHQREVQQLNSTLEVLRNTRPERPVGERVGTNVQQERARPIAHDEHRLGHHIGDRVRIINNYQNLQGTTGTITYISGHRVFVRIYVNNEERIVRRAHHNLDPVEDN
jgi:hypothetical protein